ncbi:hypothetical protein MMC13_007084 [Lambiella insularis]|nr:hypothetical protein [Lambiella insularis]
MSSLLLKQHIVLKILLRQAQSRSWPASVAPALAEWERDCIEKLARADRILETPVGEIGQQIIEDAPLYDLWKWLYRARSQPVRALAKI